MVREHRSGPRFSERFDQYGPPLPASGIVARSRRGAIGESWWSGRFLAVLTELGVGGRLDRGKHYARAGQVTALTVAPGAITATVQGSRSEPYAVRIGLRTFADEAWEAILDALAADSWYAAALLAGEVPDDLEDVLARVGLSLFPQGSGELPMDCSCPDWSVPCKHLAAVAYLAAEEFDEDPFALLRWRGRDRATLLAALRERRDAGAATPTALTDLLDRFHTPGAPVPEPDPGPRPSSRPVAALAPPSDALLDELPPLVLADGTDVREVLRPLYRRLGEAPGG
jgi:uncharacterized Zn finger protein